MNTIYRGLNLISHKHWKKKRAPFDYGLTATVGRHYKRFFGISKTRQKWFNRVSNFLGKDQVDFPLKSTTRLCVFLNIDILLYPSFSSHMYNFNFY